MGSMFRNLLALRQLSQRTVSTSTQRSLRNRVPEKQRFFQEDNGLPIHLKGGVSDMVLYTTTMILMVSGVCYALYQIGRAAFPQRK